jgi:predicted PurR-regulated permease PerM
MDNEKTPALRIHSVALLLLLAIALWLVYRIFSPFLHAFILASVLAAIFGPLQLRIMERLRWGKAAAAALTLLVVVVCVALPAGALLGGLATQGATSLAKFNAWLAGADFKSLLSGGLLRQGLDWAQQTFPGLVLSESDIQSNLLSLSRTLGQTLLAWGAQFLGNAAFLLLHFLIMLFLLFFLLKDGRQWLRSLRRISPLRPDQEDTIIDSLRRVSRAVLVGGLMVAVLQGVLGGVGLVLAGIPGLFWGAMMGLASLVPVAGTGLIWGPAAIYLFVVGSWQKGIFLLAWCVLGVTSIDTFLRPYFMRGAAKVSTVFIFLSVIGGLNAFGALGILYGPLILSFAMALLHIFTEEFGEQLSREKECLPKGGGKE